MAIQLATLGNGCFWCTEAIFKQLKGVQSVRSGFSGGTIKNPAYREVVTGRTGHAEVLQIQYDDSLVSFAKLLEVFFATHDPTTLNRQGNDVGTQYRSAIFYHDMKQKESAMATIEALQTSDAFADQIVTEVTAFEVFYPAEDYHNDYFASHGHEPYCSLVIAPKVKKFMQKFAEDMKPRLA